MISICLRASLFFVITLLIAPHAMAELQLGKLKFNDRDWTLEQQGDISALRKGSGALLVSQPRALSGSPEKALRDVLLSAGGKPDWKVLPVSLAAGYDGLLATGFSKSGGTRSYVTAMVVYEGQQFVSLALVDVGNKGRNKLKQSFGRILKTLTIDGWRKHQRGRKQQADIAGFYAALGSKTAVSSVGSLTVQAGVNGMWLTDSGHIIYSETAMAGDAKAYCKAYPRQCGQYQYSEGKLTTTRVATKQLQKLQLRKRESRPLQIDGQDLILGEKRYRFIAPMSGLKLNGQYRVVSSGSRRGADDQTATAASQVVYGFKPDGTFFRGQYFAGFNSGGVSTAVVEADGERAAGRYVVDGFTLRLSYNNGKTENKAFFMYDDIPVISGYLHQKTD